MKYTKAFAFGVLLWLLMFAGVAAVLSAYQNNDWVKVATAFVGGLLSLILAGWLNVRSRAQGIAYGAIFVIIGLLLDYLVTKRFSPDIFSERTLWLGYLLVLLAPVLRMKKHAAEPTPTI